MAKVSRVDTAYERLKTEILFNRMPPGYQASEPEIADSLSMSRTPVREALIRLEADGLIRLVPRRGAKVLPISPVDMAEIYELLTALEPEAATGLAKNIPSDEDMQTLVSATEEMEQALDQQNLLQWAAADDRFHRKLVALHNNRRLSAVVNSLFDLAHRARIVTLRLRALPVKSTKEHREILEHILAGDPKAVRKVFRQHRERAAKELLTILENYQFSTL